MNRKTLKRYHRALIRSLAIRTIKKYQPGVIAITGSVGKTSAKDALYAVLSSHRTVRATTKNFNNELGVPLTILGSYPEIGGWFFWLKVIGMACLRLLFRMQYPELLILEYGIDKPGDMKYLLDIARPQIAVVTAIGQIPVHVEFFSGPEALAREKAKIVEGLPSTGFAVLNSDDEVVYDMRERTRAHVMGYGFNEGAEVRITNYEVRMDDGVPAGISFKLNYGGSFVPVRLDGVFGRAQAYATAAAASIGIVFGLNLVKIAEAVHGFKAPAGRGRLIPGIKHTFLFDDAYNAAPLSMRAAVDTLEHLQAKRKVAILGDMLEIGKYTVEAHEEIGMLIPERFAVLVTVGPRAKFIAEAARRGGMPPKAVISFDTVEEAIPEMEHILKKGDLVLIKASHAIGLDKLVAALAAEN
ncbi:UDP-N-acetylmuramoyl-tripeptide--D-alanyl-D-alanine ligase [Patescibacteria group bacterium]|nr:UDP-N-acetylmuramoyl-tripeptide--D-alanyl-D-alanine ligase [Patescibacteria group bacterium]